MMMMEKEKNNLNEKDQNRKFPAISTILPIYLDSGFTGNNQNALDLGLIYCFLTRQIFCLTAKHDPTFVHICPAQNSLSGYEAVTIATNSKQLSSTVVSC